MSEERTTRNRFAKPAVQGDGKSNFANRPQRIYTPFWTPEKAKNLEPATRLMAIDELITKNKRLITKGRSRYYFERRDGNIDYLELEEQDVKLLQFSKIAICEDSKGEIAIIPGRFLADLNALDPSWRPAPILVPKNAQEDEPTDLQDQE
jgi:hypothetical protein